MAIIDSTRLTSNTVIQSDVCVIGAGAAGITLVRELADTPLSISLLESGGFELEEDVQELYDFENVGHPIRQNFMSRVRQFGGSCNLWAGRAMRLGPIDFEHREWVPNSGWPLSYDQLLPFYERADQVLKLPNQGHFDRGDGLEGMDPREQAFLSSDEVQPVLARWGIKPMRFGKVYRRELKGQSNLQVYTRVHVTELVPSDNGKNLDRVVAVSQGGAGVTVQAKVVVLACGGLESARLMLASTRGCPDGVGNDRQLVGRYYLDHPRMIYGRIRLNRPISLPYLTGLPISDGKVQLGIGLSDRIQRERGLVNSYVSLEPQLSDVATANYGRSINVMKILLRKGHSGGRFQFRAMDMSDVRDLIYFLTPKELMPHFLYRPYAMLKRAVRKTISSTHLTIINFCEQVPDPASRVTLGNDTDRLGVRRLRLDWRVGPEVQRSVEALHEVLARRVKDSGVGEMESPTEETDWEAFTDASHHMGTTRMSESSTTGVVDANCRVHSVDNLYVAGSGVFPTAGHANPTLTIVALALRLADHLKGELANG